MSGQADIIVFIFMFIIIPTYAQTSSVKLILKLFRHVSVLIHHLQGVYKLYHTQINRNYIYNNNNNNNIYLLQLGCHPVAVIILHVYKI